MALMAICRCISPLSVSEKIACTIWDGAARKSGLATNRRLISSQRVSPPRTDKTPAKLRSRVPCQTRATACASVASAGDATPCVETLMLIPPPKGEGGRAKRDRVGADAPLLVDSDFVRHDPPPGRLRRPPSPFGGGIAVCWPG